MATPAYQELAAKKRAAQLSLIPPEWRLSPIPSVESTPNALSYIRRLLTPAELALTEETNITILLRQLASGDISSLVITRAFAKRAALAHQLTACCTEIFFEEAFETARAMDEYLAQTGETIGPLHGLPVSIKDLFSVKGVDTSIGILPLLQVHQTQQDDYKLTIHPRLGRPNKQPLPNRQNRRPDPPPPRRNPLRENQSPPINDDVRLVQPRLRSVRAPAQPGLDLGG